MAKPTRWRSLRLGLIVLAVLVMVPVLVIYAPGIGRPTITLYVATDDATGVIRGTEVWHSGERIGQVKKTVLRPVSADTSQRVLVRLEIIRDLAPRIRRDTRAQIRPGTSMLGTPVVYLSGGSPRSAAVREGDTLIAQPQTPLDETRAAIAVGIAQIPALEADVESLTTQLFSHSGTIGAANTREAGDQRVTILDSLTHELRGRTHAARPVAVLDSDRDALNTASKHARATIDTTHRWLTTPVGTVGRLRTDSALRHQVREASRTLPF